ncbi:ras association domain-containing protein 9-like isoform X2 [Lineus longissimus]
MNDPDEAEIPVWINGSEKLMTGLTKRTTCDDVIYSLLMSQGISNGDVETYNYMIIERWRKMERDLQGRAKIVKVWKAWGSERKNVNFVVRKLEIPAAAMIRSRRTRKPHRRQRDVNSEFYDPEKVRAEKMRVQNIEDLVHLVREQQRRMHEQSGRINETDLEIDQFETKVHLQRISKRGQNYVQDSYLSLHSLSDDSSHGSGLEDALPNSIHECELEMYLKICDNILQLEEKITLEKNKLEDLQFQVEEISNCGSEPDLDMGQSGVKVYCARDEKVVRDNLKISMSLTDYNHQELHKLSQGISECDNALRRKHEYMEHLMKELEAAERAESCFQGQGHVMQYGAIYAVGSSAGSDSSEISNHHTDNSIERVHVPTVGSFRPEDRFTTRINSCNSSADSNESSPPTGRTVRFSDSSSTSDDRGYFSPVLETCSEYPDTHFPRPLKSILKNTAYSFSCNDLHSVAKHGYDDNDSNSDTGLSSLHSDEAMPILETLV